MDVGEFFKVDDRIRNEDDLLYSILAGKAAIENSTLGKPKALSLAGCPLPLANKRWSLTWVEGEGGIIRESVHSIIGSTFVDLHQFVHPPHGTGADAKEADVVRQLEGDGSVVADGRAILVPRERRLVSALGPAQEMHMRPSIANNNLWRQRNCRSYEKQRIRRSDDKVEFTEERLPGGGFHSLFQALR